MVSGDGGESAADPATVPRHRAKARRRPAQVDYAIKPTESRKYTIEAKGAADSVLGLFEEVDGVPRLLSGDDDSGENRNASINYKLFNGRNYIARLRVVHPGQSGTTSLMMS